LRNIVGLRLLKNITDIGLMTFNNVRVKEKIKKQKED